MKPPGVSVPAFARSIRFRLTLVYSLALFLIASGFLLMLYAALARSLDEEPISRTYEMPVLIRTANGVIVAEAEVRQQLRTFESVVNERALEQLRTWSFIALGSLFVLSLGIGWVVAGRALQPVQRITDVARDIQASDLSRRIALRGPDDELKQLADTFDGMLGRLDTAFASQQRFVHEASHELRNPLATIRANLDVALADPDASAADLRQTAAVVERAAARMSRVVDDLLSFARRESRTAEPERVDAAVIGREVAAEFRAPADAAVVRLEVGIDPALWVTVDAGGLRQSLANLLANAVDLAPEVGTITVNGGRRDGWVWLSVTDDGPGIAAEDHARVFQRYWRSDHNARRRPEGSGLGLSLVRQVAEDNGGQVRLESEPGRGSRFTVWLPADSAEPQAPPAPARRPQGV